MWPLYDKRGLPWPLFDKQGKPRTWVVIPLFVFMTAAYILVAIAVTLYSGLAYAAIYWILSGVFLFFLAVGLSVFLMKRRQEAKIRCLPARRALPIWRDRGYGMDDSSRARIREWPQGTRPSWGAGRPASRPPQAQLRHLREIIRLIWIGALLLILVPFILSTMGAPVLALPTPPPAIPYLIAWLLLSIVWILVWLALGWWWGPFDFVWVVPLTDAQVTAARRNARSVGTVSKIAPLAIVVLIFVGRFGFMVVAMILALAVCATFALGLAWITSKTYRQIWPSQ